MNNWQLGKAQAFSKDMLAPTLNWDYFIGYPWRTIIQGCLLFGDPALKLKLTENPMLSYSPETHDFGEMIKNEVKSTSFDIRNNWSRTLEYYLSVDCDWISVIPSSGSCAADEVNTITVSIDTTGLEYGTHTSSIKIDSNDKNGSFEVSLTVMNRPPNEPFKPSPVDGEIGVNVNPVLSVDVSDPDDDPMTITFYDASDDSVIGVVENVQSGGKASTLWSFLDYDRPYRWYAVADDGEFNETFNIWEFRTQQDFDINIDINNFNMRKVSVEVYNQGYSSFTDINYTIIIKGGMFSNINFSCSGIIDTLGAKSSKMLTSDSSGFGFGIGMVDVTVEVYVNDMFCSKTFSGFMLGRSLIVFP
jgi:hypothetical protein